MNPRLRDYFDEQLEHVLQSLPERITGLLDEVPLHVEDYPDDAILQEMGISHRDELCGLYTGIPLTGRSIEISGKLPDVVTIFREGVMHLAADPRGHLNQNELRRQIRITLLHELGHHHGLDEDDLRELGYG